MAYLTCVNNNCSYKSNVLSLTPFFGHFLRDHTHLHPWNGHPPGTLAPLEHLSLPHPPKMKKIDLIDFPLKTCLLYFRHSCLLEVLLFHVPHGAAKLEAVKLFSFFKNYIFLFMYHNVIWKQRHLWTIMIFSSTKTLTTCNFVAP